MYNFAGRAPLSANKQQCTTCTTTTTNNIIIIIHLIHGIIENIRLSILSLVGISSLDAVLHAKNK